MKATIDKCAGLAALVAAAVIPAKVAAVELLDISFTNCDGPQCDFTKALVGLGPVNDTFTVTPLVDGTLNAVIGSGASLNLPGGVLDLPVLSINLGSITINDGVSDTFFTLTELNSGAPLFLLTGDYGTLNGYSVIANQTYTVTVSGNVLAAGLYGGRLTLAPTSTPAVPEPETWLGMILGFGVLGTAMRWRRRQNIVVRVRYT